jgi:hypothetical protein
MNESDFPDLYESADNSSLDGQKSFLFWTKVRLCALVLAALCGAIDVETNGMNPAALAGVAMFVVAIFAEMYLLLERPERTCYEGSSGGRVGEDTRMEMLYRWGPFPHRLLMSTRFS